MGLATLASTLAVSPAFALLAIPAVSFVVWNIVTFAVSPLRSYPGPFLAKWTNFWRLYHVTRGNFHHVLMKLHAQYGPVVRIGPNIVDLDMPSVAKTAFSLKEEWRKTEFYHGSSALVDGHIVYNIFSETDPQKHARSRKPVSKYYALASILALEPNMDAVVEQLCAQLEARFVDSTKNCDLGEWLSFYAWDVVGAVTFSEPMGYLARGRDFDGTLHKADRAMDYFAAVGMMPSLDRWLDKNPVYRFGPPGFDDVVAAGLGHVAQRRAPGGDTSKSRPVADFLDHFLEMHDADPEAVPEGQIVSMLMINLFAGADTTAITIRSALYYGLRTPGVWARLRADLAAVGIVSGESVAPYRLCRASPYLDAVVREALRILPGVSMPLERYVPPSGFRLDKDSFLPGGTIVGLNPYVIGRNREVWGDDAESFRPERWLRADGEADDAFQARLRAMNEADLSFGGGRRVCIGKHMGLVQVFKVVATLAVRYDTELVHPEREWTVTNSWFPRQEGLEVRLSRK